MLALKQHETIAVVAGLCLEAGVCFHDPGDEKDHPTNAIQINAAGWGGVAQGLLVKDENGNTFRLRVKAERVEGDPLSVG